MYPTCNFRLVTSTVAGNDSDIINQVNSGVLRINSIYDPSNAALGTFNTTSSWYKYLNAFYLKYEVLAVKLVTTFRQMAIYPASQNPGAGLNVIYPTVMCGVKVDDDATITGPAGTDTWVGLCSDPNVKMRAMQLNNNGNARVTILTYWSAAKWFASTDRDGNLAAFGANPSNVVYAVPFLQAKDLGLTDPVRDYQISIEHELRFRIRVWDEKDVVDLSDDVSIKQEVLK